jgi:O-antigen ligase
MRAIRVGICVLVAFAVLFYGAVELWAQAVLAIGAAALLVVWGVRVARRREYELRGNWLLAPLGGLVLVTLAQRVFRLSAYPYATQISLLDWLSYLLLFFLAVQTFRNQKQWRAFFWFLLALGFVISLVGIAQFFTSPTKLYWIHPLHHGGAPFGPFVNRNNFAGFVELTAAPGLALLLLGAVRTERVPLVAVLTMVPVGALALSASRGGILSFVCQLVLLLILAWNYRPRRQQLALGLGLAALAAMLIAWIGISGTVQRFMAPSETRITSGKRIAMMKDTWHIFLDHPVAGTGMGTLETVYPQYETQYDGRIVNHTHNDYLEFLSDAGTIGGACGLAFLLMLLWGGFRNVARAENRLARGLYAGALVSCAGLMVHGLVDFNLHIPSNALLFILLAYFATGRLPERELARSHQSRF